MRRSRRLATALAVVAALAVAPSARAQLEPPVNLGATSFLDGGPPAGPGVYFNEYIQYFGADRINDASGHALPLPNPRLNVWSSINQLIFLPDFELPVLKARPAMDVLLPVVSTDISYSAPGPFPQDDGFGLGDLLLGPALQFNAVTGENGPIFVNRLEAQFIIPTGKYSNERVINPGSGFFSFDPYWAGTLFLSKKLELSWRAHYLWNAANHNPLAVPGVESTQAGQAFHTNFAMSYEVIEKHLRVGINGYWLKQTSDSSVNGNTIPGREQVLGIGPGAIYSFNEKNHIFFNAYIETEARNRPEGTRLTLRYVKKF
jgi:anthranilate 1,2-dioxygenase (deaminating, decarboxylating) large subunit